MLIAQEVCNDGAKAVCDTAALIRDQIHAQAMASPLAPLVIRIQDLLLENETLIFWGGACCFAVTHYHLFLCGAAMSFTIAHLCAYPDPEWADVDITALRQIVKAIILVSGYWIPTLARAVMAGISPGFHTYQLLSGRHYGKSMQGFRALDHEIGRFCWQLAFWIPFLNRQDCCFMKP